MKKDVFRKAIEDYIREGQEIEASAHGGRMPPWADSSHGVLVAALGEKHSRCTHFVMVGAPSRIPAAYATTAHLEDAALKRLPLKIESLRETVRWLEIGLLDDAFDSPPPGPPSAVPPLALTFNNSPTQYSTATASASLEIQIINAAWTRAERAIGGMSENRDEALDLLRSIRKDLEDNTDHGLRGRLEQLAGIARETFIEVLPALLAYAPYVSAILR